MNPADVTGQPLIVSFLFALDTEQGHLFEYNKSVGVAARAIGWEHRAAVRAQARVKELPQGWERCLGKPTTRFHFKPMVRVEKLANLCRSLVDYLKSLPYATRPVILFLEWFDLVHVIPFHFALRQIPAQVRPQLWVMYRLDYTNVQMRLIHQLFASAAGERKLTVLSDSELVVARLNAVVKQPIHILPIPHTESVSPDQIVDPPWATAKDKTNYITCWLPGSAIPAKGSEIVRRLVAENGPFAPQICVAAARNAQYKEVAGGCRVISVEDVLPRAEYEGWLQAMDVALLPYDPAFYGARTSGIFVEAVTAGKLPLVTDKTWMAHELRKYGLDDLILKWNDVNLGEQIVALTQRSEIKAQLARMQTEYHSFHNLQEYGRVLLDIQHQAEVKRGRQFPSHEPRSHSVKSPSAIEY